MTLDDILEHLQADRQRATYGAVASLLACPPMFLMNGRDRCHLDSWIVSKPTKLPSGYDETEMHPDLCEKPRVIETRHELAGWLQDRLDSGRTRD